MTIDTVKEHIVSTPDVLGGKPRIAGTRIAVHHIAVWHDRLGMSADTIATEYNLSLADVYAGLAYYHDHQDVINAVIHDEEAFVAAMQQQTPSKLKGKIGG
jgi:uncharacterized protein (DUF433 family)